jgi:hypothetical protein
MLHTDTRETTECGEHEAAAATTTAPAVPAAPAAGHELFFQRCLWCGIPAYRRSFCRACGSTAFRRERCAGAGAVVRRTGHAAHHSSSRWTKASTCSARSRGRRRSWSGSGSAPG